MANRSFYPLSSSVLRDTRLPVTLVGQGSGKAPKLQNGDPNATWFNQPAFVSTGVFTLTTADGYPATAVIGCMLSYVQNTSSATSIANEGPGPTQSATTGAWTFTINTYASGSAADMAAGATPDLLRVEVILQNSGFQV